MHNITILNLVFDMKTKKILFDSQDKAIKTCKYFHNHYNAIDMYMLNECAILIDDIFIRLSTEYCDGESILAIDKDCYFNNEKYFIEILDKIDPDSKICIIDFDEFI